MHQKPFHFPRRKLSPGEGEHGPGSFSKTGIGLGLEWVLLCSSLGLLPVSYRLTEVKAPTELWRLDGRPHGGALNLFPPCPQPHEAKLRQRRLLVGQWDLR